MNKADEIRKLTRKSIYNANKELIDYLLHEAEIHAEGGNREASWTSMIKYEGVTESVFKMKLDLIDVVNYFKEEGFNTNFETEFSGTSLIFKITIKW